MTTAGGHSRGVSDSIPLPAWMMRGGELLKNTSSFSLETSSLIIQRTATGKSLAVFQCKGEQQEIRQSTSVKRSLALPSWWNKEIYCCLREEAKSSVKQLFESPNVEAKDGRRMLYLDLLQSGQSHDLEIGNHEYSLWRCKGWGLLRPFNYE